MTCDRANRWTCRSRATVGLPAALHSEGADESDLYVELYIVIQRGTSSIVQ